MAITFAIDISHHQDKALNLAQTRRDGCELAILKAGEGNSFVDPDFASNLAEARAAGQLVAAYWYQRSTVTASQHVAAIQRVVPRDVPVIPDVEASSGSIELTRNIVAGLRAAGYSVPLLYLPRWYWQQLASPSLAGLPPLWSSRYPNNVVGLLASEWAEVPASYWTGYGGLDVALLQFTSSARIAGYQPLDASAFRGDRTQLAALLGGQNQEADMPFTPDDFRAFMWGNVFDTNGNRNFAGYVKDMDAKLGALGTSLAAVTKLLTDNPDNPVDVDQLAAALEGKLVAELVPAVTAAVGQAAGEEAADEVRKMLVARLGNPA